MNSAVHHNLAAQRHLDDLREARRNAFSAVPPKERRLSAYGARFLGRAREHGRVIQLRPAAER
jgi:hypothetical protein